MARCTGIRSTRDDGFTLMELVVIILLLGILTFTAIPRFLDKGAIDVSVMAEQLANDIRYTQSLAMTSGQRNRINLTATTYQITTSSGGLLTHPVTGGTGPIVLGGVTLSGWSPPLTMDYVAFDGRGVPYSLVTSSTGLATNATITLSGGGRARNIVISPETGRVVVQ
jgi:Tfp pilus assembly protein FimT